MNTQTNLVLVLAAGLLAGCHRKNPAAPDPSEPRIQGDRIVMSNADGYAGSISVQSAAKGTRGNLHFNGRLTWDDDVTVRVFTPFAGRVMQILVETGRTVERKTPLALIASPDFGQAQADARRAESRPGTACPTAGASAPIRRRRISCSRRATQWWWPLPHSRSTPCRRRRWEPG